MGSQFSKLYYINPSLKTYLGDLTFYVGREEYLIHF